MFFYGAFHGAPVLETLSLSRFFKFSSVLRTLNFPRFSHFPPVLETLSLRPVLETLSLSENFPMYWRLFEFFSLLRAPKKKNTVRYSLKHETRLE